MRNPAEAPAAYSLLLQKKCRFWSHLSPILNKSSTTAEAQAPSPIFRPATLDYCFNDLDSALSCSQLRRVTTEKGVLYDTKLIVSSWTLDGFPFHSSKKQSDLHKHGASFLQSIHNSNGVYITPNSKVFPTYLSRPISMYPLIKTEKETPRFNHQSRQGPCERKGQVDGYDGRNMHESNPQTQWKRSFFCSKLSPNLVLPADGEDLAYIDGGYEARKRTRMTR
ncbi:hypothetical protein CC1G_04389 [Coprinopsis cinerea okayama7|uniref:Uncharacterized protein n=1 Tax=Coprinopsis cinerea (strain Okayama-7 / 130 / ATCC MYA-4618 / FGSC 9003) TaxID=240176 RepID=A8N0G8_COPC7|nr:hypothetical protein CC1G_04389 [Coprinopsis cinerea okayama7\|eukprot:XP_001828418.2 hypothetical protein CC1G_04389 [Coprinopsis cinerea okayama7\